MAICYPLSACSWLQNKWPWVPISRQNPFLTCKAVARYLCISKAFLLLLNTNRFYVDKCNRILVCLSQCVYVYTGWCWRERRVYLNDWNERMNPNLSAVGMAHCRTLRKKWIFSLSDLRCHCWITNSIVLTYLLIFFNCIAMLYQTFT